MLSLRVKKIICILGTALSLGTQPLLSQVGQSYFQGEPTNLHDWRAAIQNPSLGVLQAGAFEAGFKVLHFGFVDGDAGALKAGYLILNVPRRLPYQFALGLQTQIFHSPLFSENDLRLSISRRFSSRLALGIGFGLRGISYSTDRFTPEVLADPVFAGKSAIWKPDLGLGLTFMPLNSLIIGAGIQHINRPNVSLVGDATRLEPILSLGIRYLIGAATINAGSRLDNISLTRGASVQFYDDQLGLLQLGASNDALEIFARVNVTRTLRVGYGLSYPITQFSGMSAGSHEAAISFEFDRLRKMIELAEVPEEWRPIQPDVYKIRVVPQFLAMPNRSTVDIVTKTIYRRIQLDDSTALRRLSAFDLGLDDSLSGGTPLFLTYISGPPSEKAYLSTIRPGESLAPSKNFNITLRDTAKTSKEMFFITDSSYFRFLKELGQDLLQHPKKKTLIVTPNAHIDRAYLIAKYLSDSLQVPSTQFAIRVYEADSTGVSGSKIPLWDRRKLQQVQQIRVAEPPSVEITVFPIDSSSYVRRWTFVVEDKSGKRIFTRSGISEEAYKFEWDWRDNRGRLIEHGFYRYYIEWEDDAGATRRSAPRLFLARELRSTVEIIIDKKYDGIR